MELSDPAEVAGFETEGDDPRRAAFSDSARLFAKAYGVAINWAEPPYL
jgi:hypothetical protein